MALNWHKDKIRQQMAREQRASRETREFVDRTSQSRKSAKHFKPDEKFWKDWRANKEQMKQQGYRVFKTQFGWEACKY
jgi:hypothetical protein